MHHRSPSPARPGRYAVPATLAASVLAFAGPLWPLGVALLGVAALLVAWQYRTAYRTPAPPRWPARDHTALTAAVLDARDARRSDPSPPAAPTLVGTAQVFAVVADDAMLTIDAVVQTPSAGPTLTTLRLVQPHHLWLRSSVQAMLAHWSDDAAVVGIELRDRAGQRTARFTHGDIRVELPVEQYAALT